MTQSGKKSFKEGLFTPKNPEKYIGNLEEIKYRSSWEEYAFNFLDGNPNVLHWASEPIAISYRKPIMVNGQLSWKPANYFPDLFVEFINRDGTIVKELIEIKPLKQNKASKSKKESVRLQENYVVMVNNAKCEAAKAWCERYGIKFSILTEKSLFR
jgi:TnsA endonuclease N terminal